MQGAVTLHLWNARVLAEELGRGQLSARLKSYYLFAGFPIWLIANATGLVLGSPLWSWMSFIEAAALLLITVLGFAYAYRAAGGDDNHDFVVQFSCLYVPVSVSTVVVVWGLFWAISYGFRESILAFSESRLQLALGLARIGSNLFEVLVVLAVLVVQALTFYRITRLLRLVRAEAAARVLPARAST